MQSYANHSLFMQDGVDLKDLNLNKKKPSEIYVGSVQRDFGLTRQLYCKTFLSEQLACVVLSRMTKNRERNAHSHKRVSFFKAFNK